MEYNTKTRIGIWMCLLLMVAVLCFVLAGVFRTARELTDTPVNAEKPDEDAILVDAKPQESENTEENAVSERTEATTEESSSTEKKALYYVTLSGDEVVLLDEYGEVISVLHENADFLPEGDLDAIRAGIALYSKEEMEELRDDLS